MTSSPKIVGEEKSCGPRLALTALFPICLSLLGPYLVAAAWFSVKLVAADGEEVIMVVCLYRNATGEAQGRKMKSHEPFLAFLSLSFCPSLSFPPSFSFSTLFPSSPFIISWLSSCLSPLSGHLSSPLSILFHNSLPPPRLSSLLLPPRFCRGRVEVISRCVTLAMCRQWMGLWQWLDSSAPLWQRRTREGNNYTYTWEDVRLFTKLKKWDSGFVIYYFIFPPSDWWPELVNVNPLFAVWPNMLACKAAVVENITWRNSSLK